MPVTKQFANMTLVEVCRFHMENEFTEGRSLCIVRDMAEKTLEWHDDYLKIAAWRSDQTETTLRIQREVAIFHEYLTYVLKALTFSPKE